MDNNTENYSVNSHIVETNNSNIQLCKKYEDSRTVVTELFKELSLWKEESHEKFSNIIHIYSTSINKAIDALTEEVCDLQSQLSVSTNERNGSIKTVNDLTNEISPKLPTIQSVHYLNLDTQVVNRSEMESSDTKQSRDKPEPSNDSCFDFPQSPDTQQNIETSESSNVLTNVGTDDTEQKKDDKVDHMVPQCNFPLSTSENVMIHSQNVHSKLPFPDTKQNIKRSESLNDLSCFDFPQSPDTKQNIENSESLSDFTLNGTDDTEQKRSDEEVAQIGPQYNFALLTSENLTMHLENAHPKLEHSLVSLEPTRGSPVGNTVVRVESEGYRRNDAIILQKNEVSLNQELEISNEEENKIKCEQFPHKTSNKEELKCEQCPFTSAKQSYLNRHTEGVHKKIKNHVCGECGYSTSKKAHLIQHSKAVHENIKNHVCEKCGFAASAKGGLNEHIKAVHENMKNHTCGECSYSASNRRNLKRHVEAVHENIKHVCKECGYGASQRSHLKRHMKTVHMKGEKHENIRTKNRVCKQCGYATSLKSLLKQHIEAVHNKVKNHVCEECGYAASRKFSLKFHNEAVHKKIRNHMCEQCGFATSQKKGLKKHMQAVHGSHICEECGFAASGKLKLKQHLKTVHMGDKIFQCQKCPYKATRRGHLEKHTQARHEKIREKQRQVCDKCGYVAPKMFTLKEHIEAVHDNIRNNVCVECGYAASLKSNLNRHIKTVHKNKE